MQKRFFLLFPILIGLSISLQAAKLAIVIDDIGYRSDDFRIYEMPKEISVAIIPSSPHATSRAQLAKQQQRDILIHQPMQAKGNHAIEKEALRLGMSSEQVRQQIDFARQRVPHAIGLNNHMGSAATADRTLMNHLMKLLAQYDLYFLDSYTTGGSVAVDVAEQYHIPSLTRHVFLDDVNTLENTQKQFRHAIQYARKHGLAIVIGHPRRHTIQALQQGLAKLPNDIELVKISSLWQQKQIELIKPPYIYLFSEAIAPTSKAPFTRHDLLRGVPN